MLPRILLLLLALLCSGIDSRAGMASYTDRGTIDFDAALKVLNPYGTWSKIDGVWAYTPLDREAPYTNGRWLYTEYGWYWKGNHPHSWITEHYGFWKRGEDKVWSWYPGPNWLSEIVEFRATPTHIGWRSGEVDQNGDYVEAPDDRYAKTDEWTFVTKTQFANPITPAIVAKPDVVETLMEDSTDCQHAYLTYRPIDRPGPHPADFVNLCKDGGMLSPLQTEEILPPPAPTAPKPVVNTSATNNPAAKMTGIVQPAIAGTADDADDVDTRQVKYWVTMSLPTYWTPKPGGAKPEELYLYRPEFYQDQDGIARRITLWFNPLTKTSLKEVFAESASRQSSTPAITSGNSVLDAQPATPAVSANAHDPFRSPLDASYQPKREASTSSKGSAGTSAPNGLANTTNGVPADTK